MSAQPGWYPDPWELADLRWWDGVAWTEHMSQPRPPAAPLPPAGPPAAAPLPPSPFASQDAAPTRARVVPAWAHLLAGVAAIVIVLGSALPWATISAGPFGTVEVNGLDGDGAITIVLGLVLGGLAVAGIKATTHRAPMLVALALAGLVALIAIIDVVDLTGRFSDLASGGDDLGFDIDVGVGLWLTLVGALAAGGGCLASLVAKQTS